MSKKNILEEMKQNSGIEISADKTLRAYARLSDSFASLISNIKQIKFDAERKPYYGSYSDMASQEEIKDRCSKPDIDKLYVMAKSKMEIINQTIEEYLGNGKSSDDDDYEDDDE